MVFNLNGSEYIELIKLLKLLHIDRKSTRLNSSH